MALHLFSTYPCVIELFDLLPLTLLNHHWSFQAIMLPLNRNMAVLFENTIGM